MSNNNSPAVHPDQFLSTDQHQLALLVKHVVPGCEDLSQTQALAFRAHCMKTGANPWRGEAYPMVNKKGEFFIIDGYKWLTMWAQHKDPFTDDYTPLTRDEMPSTGFLGYRCYILKRRDQEFYLQLIQAGMETKQARETATISATGVLHRKETSGRRPPHGWTWDDVARKRVLKNALNKSHGAPTLEELQQLAAESGQPTFDELLLQAPTDIPAQARERYVDLVQTTQAGAEVWEAMDDDERRDRFRTNVDTLRGPDQIHTDPLADDAEARAEFYRLASDGNGRMRTEAIPIVNQALGAKITWAEALTQLREATNGDAA